MSFTDEAVRILRAHLGVSQETTRAVAVYCPGSRLSTAHAFIDERELSVELQGGTWPSENQGRVFLLQGDGAAADAALLQLAIAGAPTAPHIQDKDRVYLFVDNSNVVIGASNAGGVIDIAQMTDRLVRGRTCCVKVVAGSMPPVGANIWEQYAELGYHVRLGVRGSVPGECNVKKEVFVDDALHASISKILLDSDVVRHSRRTIILCTGDGNDNEGANNFPFLVHAALEHGFSVEVYAWRASCSTKYVQLAAQRDKCSLAFFDDIINLKKKNYNKEKRVQKRR